MEERSGWRPYDRDAAAGNGSPHSEGTAPDAGDRPRAEREDAPAESRHEREDAPAESRHEREDPESRPAQEQHEPSTVDAMGQEKHREVIGQRYGASRGRQFLYYGIFVAFLVVVYIGGKIVVSELDKAPAKDTDQAPWSKPDAPQSPLGGFEPRDPDAKGPANFQ